MEQDGEKYYLATSPDLYGLVVEADTLPEILELTPQVANELIEINNQTTTPHSYGDKFELWTDVSYKMVYKPLQVYSLQYA